MQSSVKKVHIRKSSHQVKPLIQFPKLPESPLLRRIKDHSRNYTPMKRSEPFYDYMRRFKQSSEPTPNLLNTQIELNSSREENRIALRIKLH